MNNPYPYSNDNKRYQTINYYFRNKYHQKVAKIPLNAGFTCPNRDGFKGTGGCTFCSSMGSGDSILCFDDSLQKQYQEGLKRMQNKCILIGLVGAAIPLGLLYVVYNRVISYVMTEFSVLSNFMAFMPVSAVFRILLPVGLILGMGIGLVGSIFTIRKHLKV